MGAATETNRRAMEAEAQRSAVAADGWTCSCGNRNTGKFCSECGSPKPAPAGSWKCACGAENSGKFCSECGSPKPAAEWTCACGNVNPAASKFCSNCGKKR